VAIVYLSQHASPTKSRSSYANGGVAGAGDLVGADAAHLTRRL
jgi:hypothetical protein